MTEAEQVACDALRSAGLDDVADNLAFAREAVKVRATILKAVTFIGESFDACISCGVSGDNGVPHDRDCSMLPLLSTQPEFWPNQIGLAHESALLAERQRATPLASQRDVLDLYRREYLGQFPGPLGLGDPYDLNAASEYAPPQAPTK